MSLHHPAGDPPPLATPTIQLGVAGRRGEDGFLLRAPLNEALAWDIESEVLSLRRAWIDERSGWWIARCYLEVVIDVVLRSFPAVQVVRGAEDRLVSREQWRARQAKVGPRAGSERAKAS